MFLKDGAYDRLHNLLSSGDGSALVSVNLKDRRTGNTALIWAAKRGHVKVIDKFNQYFNTDEMLLKKMNRYVHDPMLCCCFFVYMCFRSLKYKGIRSVCQYGILCVLCCCTVAYCDFSYHIM